MYLFDIIVRSDSHALGAVIVCILGAAMCILGNWLIEWYRKGAETKRRRVIFTLNYALAFYAVGLFITGNYLWSERSSVGAWTTILVCFIAAFCLCAYLLLFHPLFGLASEEYQSFHAKAVLFFVASFFLTVIFNGYYEDFAMLGYSLRQKNDWQLAKVVNLDLSAKEAAEAMEKYRERAVPGIGEVTDGSSQAKHSPIPEYYEGIVDLRNHFGYSANLEKYADSLTGSERELWLGYGYFFTNKDWAKAHFDQTEEADMEAILQFYKAGDAISTEGMLEHWVLFNRTFRPKCRWLPAKILDRMNNLMVYMIYYETGKDFFRELNYRFDNKMPETSEYHYRQIKIIRSYLTDPEEKFKILMQELNHLVLAHMILIGPKLSLPDQTTVYARKIFAISICPIFLAVLFCVNFWYHSLRAVFSKARTVAGP